MAIKQGSLSASSHNSPNGLVTLSGSSHTGSAHSHKPDDLGLSPEWLEATQLLPPE